MHFTPKQAQKIVAADEKWTTTPKSFAAFMNQEIFGDQKDRYATGPTWGRWTNQAKSFLEMYNRAVQEEVERRLDEGVAITQVGREDGDSGQSDEPDTNSDDDYAYGDQEGKD